MRLHPYAVVDIPIAEKSGTSEAPLYFVPTRLMKELGYGHAYCYAHNEPGAFAAGERYLPEGMAEPNWH